MNKLNSMQRSRLKLTIVGAALMFAVLLFPIYIINKAAESAIFEVSAPWIALGTIITTIGGIIGYYVNKESYRPSLISTNIVTNAKEKILDGEDESDPDNIPL